MQRFRAGYRKIHVTDRIKKEIVDTYWKLEAHDQSSYVFINKKVQFKDILKLDTILRI